MREQLSEQGSGGSLFGDGRAFSGRYWGKDGGDLSLRVLQALPLQAKFDSHRLASFFRPVSETLSRRRWTGPTAVAYRVDVCPL
jgi:hypothetical protein